MQEQLQPVVEVDSEAVLGAEEVAVEEEEEVAAVVVEVDQRTLTKNGSL
jgi:hypothetical protein